MDTYLKKNKEGKWIINNRSDVIEFTEQLLMDLEHDECGNCEILDDEKLIEIKTIVGGDAELVARHILDIMKDTAVIRMKLNPMRIGRILVDNKHKFRRTRHYSRYTESRALHWKRKKQTNP